MPIASASRLLARRPGNQNDSGAIWALARTFPENCMTLHDAEARPNLHFLSSPATLGESQKSLVFPHILPMKTGLWLGAESNRRHVDFQSTALPTELPSRDRSRFCDVPRGSHYAKIPLQGKAVSRTENGLMIEAFDNRISDSLCRLDLQLQSAT